MSNLLLSFFENILLKSKKKSGFSILVCAVSITVFLGTMAGCSIMEPSPSETQSDNKFPSEQMNDHETLSEESADNANVQTVPTQTPESEESKPDNTNNPEEALSEDGREIKRIAEELATAYFSGDIDTVQKHLTTPYEWDIDVYTGTGEISKTTLKGLTGIGDEEIGSIQVISLEYKDSDVDMLLYLTMEFIKQEDGWKVYSYGIEG